MRDARPASESSKRRWSIFSALDAVEIGVYGGLGAALLGYAIYEIGRAIWEGGSPWLLVAFVAIVAGSFGQAIRDLYRRRFSPASRLLVGAWALCAVLILLVDLFS